MPYCTIGVVGSGAMGLGIAQVAAQSGCQVLVYDASVSAMEQANARLQQTVSKLVEKGKLKADAGNALLANVQFVSSLEQFSPCELVIEAIVERLEIKQGVFKNLEKVVSANCILASNTSSLSITSIGGALAEPERFLGIHFFNPAPLMPLVEVIPGLATRNGLAEEVEEVLRSWNKVPVLAKDTPGFIVNRVARPFYGESLRILEEGIADMPTIDWALTTRAGFRMGPFTLMDFIGHDVNYTVTETVFQSFFYDPRFKPSFSQKRLVEAGWLGVKSKRGFYDYREGATKPEPTQDEKLAEMIVTRVVAMLINEAADALHLGIASAAHLELAMTKGVNYPKGLLAWANEWGTQKVVEILDQLYDEYREDRYRCNALLRRLGKNNAAFVI